MTKIYKTSRVHQVKPPTRIYQSDRTCEERDYISKLPSQLKSLVFSKLTMGFQFDGPNSEDISTNEPESREERVDKSIDVNFQAVLDLDLHEPMAFVNREARDFLRSCDEHQQVTHNSKLNNNSVNRSKTPGLFNQWELDVIGPLPPSISGNRYIITAIDVSTYLPVVRTCAEISNTTLNEFIYKEIVMEFGKPKEILTKSESNLISGSTKLYLERSNIRHIEQRPGTILKIDQNNATIMAHIMKYCKEDKKNWDLYVTKAQINVRFQKHPITGLSPFFLTYGFDVELNEEENRTPVEILQVPSNSHDPEEYDHSDNKKHDSKL